MSELVCTIPNQIEPATSISGATKVRLCRSLFGSVGRASDSQIFLGDKLESHQTHLSWQQYVGTGLAVMLADKSLAHVAPEVDLGNVHYICLCNAYKTEPTLALKPRDVTRNPKQG